MLAILVPVAALLTTATDAGPALVLDAPVMTDAVRALAVSDAGMLVLTEGSVTVLDATGRRVRRSWSAAAVSPAGASSRADEGFSLSALDLPTDLADLADLADLDWARTRDLEDLADADDPRLADVSTVVAAGRRGAAPLGALVGSPSRAAIPRPHGGVVAAGGRNGWLGRSDGLWKIELETAVQERASVALRDPVYRVAASSDGRVVAAATGSTLYTSGDGGQNFEAAAWPAAVPLALAATNAGEIFFIDPQARTLGALPGPARGAQRGSDGGLVDRPETPIVPDAVDVAGCGNLLVLLTGTSVVTIADGRVATVVDAPAGASRIACDASGRSWAAGGLAHHWRGEQGVWQAVPTPPGAATAVGIATGRLWIATSSGLWASRTKVAPPSPAHRPGTPDAVGRGRPTMTMPPSRPAAARDERALLRSTRWWTGALPRVDLVFGAARTAGRRDLRGFIVLTFALGGSGTHAAREAAARLREARLAATGHVAWLRQIDRSTAVAGEEDRISADERAALIRTLEEMVP